MTHNMKQLLGIAILLSLAFGCKETAAGDGDEGDMIGGLTAIQKHRAEQLISLFENGTIEIQYAYAEELGDGRGITAGRAGFTTATGDVLLVVQRYTERKADNPLAVYLPELERLNDAESGDTGNLDGFVGAWKEAAGDADFLAVQDEVVDELYFFPSAEYADEAGLTTALARAELYDAIIQHGEGDDPDGFPALMERTVEKADGTPVDGVDEKEWLRVFLSVRKNDLTHTYDEETREVWAESAGRCDVFTAIVESDNWDLDGPIEVLTAGYEAVIP